MTFDLRPLALSALLIDIITKPNIIQELKPHSLKKTFYACCTEGLNFIYYLLNVASRSGPTEMSVAGAPQ